MNKKLKKGSKKPIKKVVRKSVKKTASFKLPPAEKPIGKVTHFYGNIKVAIIKFNKEIRVGAKLHYRGATTDFVDTIKSMQFNHEPVKIAKKNKLIGIKVKKQVRQGDGVYPAASSK
jgi:hypothetical protein